jgi:acetyl esterase/lipase
VNSIHHPSRPSSHAPTIIYLPRGPLLHTTYSPLPTLALSAYATIISIHYRLSADIPYPTAIHDVLAGYDWIQKHLVQHDVDLDSAYPSSTTTRIGVCGELIGGSLATMLALTECRPRDSTISAAAVGNPIADWTALFPSPERSESADARISEESLVQVREKLSSKPEHYHDPFASPLLFFRTPSTSLPDPYNQGLPGLSLDLPPDPYALGEDVLAVPDRLRRSHRKYPPAGSALRLPHMRIEVGRQSGIRQQGEDLEERLLKSVKYWEDEAYGAVGAEALKAKIRLVEREGVGLWGEKELADVGGWLGDVLRR